MPDDEREQWAQRLTGLPADAFIPLALTQPALAADLFRVLAETLLQAVNDCGVRVPRGALSVEVAPEEALRISVGDDRLTFRWPGDGDTARELVEMAVWQLADRWPAPSRGKQSSLVPSVSADAWASSVLEAVTLRMTEELRLEEAHNGARLRSSSFGRSRGTAGRRTTPPSLRCSMMLTTVSCSSPCTALRCWSAKLRPPEKASSAFTSLRGDRCAGGSKGLH